MLKLKLNDIALPDKSSQSYEASHLPYGITQCYLPTDTSKLAPPNPSLLDLPTLEGWKAELT